MKKPYEPSSWMADNIEAFHSVKIRNLCIPGSHDAGMSLQGTGTAFAFPCNVQTQYLGIGDQLKLGIRYFDIRPVISGGQYYTGHYSNTGVPVLGWQGANGQSLESIIGDINAFNSTHKELIILYLSHDLDTDTGRSYQVFTQEQYDALCAELSDIQHLLFTDYPNLLDLTLGECIGKNASSPMVMIIADPENSSVKLKAGTGIWSQSKFVVYNEYSDTNNLNAMMADQLAKMKGGNGYFLLSWTLTQDAMQAATCEVPFLGGASILQLAATANQALAAKLLPACSPTVYPNIILLDGIQDDAATKLAVEINYLSLIGS